MQKQAICISIRKLANAVTVEYKIERQKKSLTIAKRSDDYDIAFGLKPGDKFIIEMRDTQLKSSKIIEIEPQTCPLPYIVKQLETR